MAATLDVAAEKQLTFRKKAPSTCSAHTSVRGRIMPTGSSSRLHGICMA